MPKGPLAGGVAFIQACQHDLIELCSTLPVEAQGPDQQADACGCSEMLGGEGDRPRGPLGSFPTLRLRAAPSATGLLRALQPLGCTAGLSGRDNDEGWGNGG